MKISSELALPCGVILPNRMAKSAMSENMANPKLFASERFYNAYRTWAKGGTGLCITGNVMIDSNHLGEANNIAIEKGLDNFDSLRKWSSSADGTASQIWVQLNHPGKQSPKFLNKTPVAPSAIALPAPLDNMFNTPKALDENEILDIIERFGFAAKAVKDCGFHGVQIHGAHGYLVSQFLSPAHNQRSDKWGGPLENRMLFVKEVYKSIRKSVGDDFPIGIKLNSADFSKGGFTHAESVLVAQELSELGIDLIEISGGSYEAPVMTGKSVKESTKKREAYFLDYASDIKKVIKCPLMVTGGFRTARFIREAINEGHLDIVGIGRALCLNPEFSKQVIDGEDVVSEVKPLRSASKILDSIFPLEIIWYTMQIHRMGQNKRPDSGISVYWAILHSIKEIGVESLKRVRS
ncbi:NADH:flavin oxidoreductase/NADH oxidase family protein [Halobacteriovorax sp. HLS]|uniref:NADH:flavin oxidoreductase/NADH oxidase family protein n=1 Tax=Halobacteriovorax sp. HLS TaxID=2234000 RepID=UPI000FD87556|nr:NADH:flavin oxidoreductase/NADH oxidase family protein [Halobacteriovorax sp. HLS]